MISGERRERRRRWAIRQVARAHVLVYRASGGRLLGRVAGMPVVLLTTTGRRTGIRRTVPLTALRSGSTLVLVASFGGDARPPAWFVNLRDDPHVGVRLGHARWSARARVATDEERERLWPLVVARHAGYGRYQARTARVIALVLLETAAQASQASACSASARAGRQTPPAACTDSMKR